ncbi:Uu.00g026630.m01.CDS01 [Anthostomella pinea]|uniref:Uu.00g026630.m01.CDS01 n=1 Tax=Anthostomella pinea TaxID=933095 RepID=A0AAI8V8K6_9PEZI|nr:Uu.00g026630.m01.CDS01 [Anthostomella pinea]
MATPLHIKRMTRERTNLEKENPDYFVRFEDDNLLKFEAYVLAPEDSLYQHKLIKLHFEIPTNYPMASATYSRFSWNIIKLTKTQGTTQSHICPAYWRKDTPKPLCRRQSKPPYKSLFVFLITIRSLLDNEPYKHEPGQRNHAEYNKYVEYTTWRSLLLDYLRNEIAESAKAFLQKHVRERGPRMIQELRRQQTANARAKHFTSPYGVRSGKSTVDSDYAGLIRDLTDAVSRTTADVTPTAAADVLPEQPSSGGVLKRLWGAGQAIMGGPNEPKAADGHQQKRVKTSPPENVVDLGDDSADKVVLLPRDPKKPADVHQQKRIKTSSPDNVVELEDSSEDRVILSPRGPKKSAVAKTAARKEPTKPIEVIDLT